MDGMVYLLGQDEETEEKEVECLLAPILKTNESETQAQCGSQQRQIISRAETQVQKGVASETRFG
jgi:hypothetical protein